MENVIDTTPATESLPRAGRKEWIGLAVIALPCLLYSMDLTVLNLALPSITGDLQPSSSQLLWIVDIYGFMVAGSLITMGTLGDRIGRRRLLLIGAAAFGIASVLAAFSTSAIMLIATRALLGITGATIAPSTLSLIRNMFHDPNQRTFAIGIWATSYSVGGAIGPLFGGIMLQYFWWGSVFLLGVPVMLLLLVVGPMLLPEFKDPKAGKLDILSAAMSLVSILAVIYCLKLFAQDGFGWAPVAIAAVGIVIGALFVRRQKKLAHPLIDLELFKSVPFRAALSTNLFAIMFTFGSFFFTAQYLQMVLGLSPFVAGLWTLPSSIGFIAASMLTPMVVKKFNQAYVIAVGLFLAAAGFIMLTQVSGGGLPLVVIASVLLSLGICPPIILSTDLVVGSAPPERSGSAASLSETSSELGGALGVAILGSLGTFIYRQQMQSAEISNISLGVKESSVETLGGALASAETLTGPARQSLVDIAQGAFTTSFEIVSVVSAMGCVAIGVLAMILLKKK